MIVTTLVVAARRGEGRADRRMTWSMPQTSNGRFFGLCGDGRGCLILILCGIHVMMVNTNDRKQ